ncbi:DUF1707 domain-containing protein [Corynebacterium sp. H127]|uniref:DUF1707 SHOCT-like domain-containing protein n=1 Tax=Corynebacterium sp. H127 TaxID=3133418 RepID=UPI00309EF6C3
MNNPRIRATDAERNKVLAYLSEAMTNGQLNFAEFDERSHAVTSATYRDELATPLQDLMPNPELFLGREVAVPQTHAVVPSRQPISAGDAGNSFSVALMSGTEKKGVWTIAPSHLSISVMGGTSLDLRQARFAAQKVTINAFAVMGGVDIIVPEDVRIICDGVALMGGFGVIDDKQVRLAMADIPHDAPTVRITGLALMGGVDVRRVPRI